MKIVLIGSGNVATQLGKAYLKTENEILQVYSNTLKNAEALSIILKCNFTNYINKINSEADVYIIALRDDVIEDFVKKFQCKGRVLVHTCASLPMDILKPASDDYGVMYPLQTFSKNRELNLKKVPIFTEGNSLETKIVITSLASAISDEVYDLNSEQRLKLHTAAVFANNFSNHLYKIAGDILKTSGLDFEILKPLIQETTDKVMKNNPADMQTGPASRKDDKTIQKHIELLKDFPEYKRIYELLSESIERNSK
jgi:predicted short-subunit dehydrogenase-like oxidoreductase (DUF2520 family)